MPQRVTNHEVGFTPENEKWVNSQMKQLEGMTRSRIVNRCIDVVRKRGDTADALTQLELLINGVAVDTRSIHTAMRKDIDRFQDAILFMAWKQAGSPDKFDAWLDEYTAWKNANAETEETA